MSSLAIIAGDKVQSLAELRVEVCGGADVVKVQSGNPRDQPHETRFPGGFPAF